jgi:hypothetical protein
MQSSYRRGWLFERRSLKNFLEFSGYSSSLAAIRPVVRNRFQDKLASFGGHLPEPPQLIDLLVLIARL